MNPKSIAGLLSDCVFLPLALIYTFAAAAFGCSGSVSVSSGADDPNRALGTYQVPGTFGESASAVFFGYWLTGDNNIELDDAEALRDAIGTIQNTAKVTIVPGSILYEETAVELASGRTITVSISGTWTYSARTRLIVNWGAAFVTGTTFSPSPPFDIATVGTRINGPQPNDTVFSANNWNQLSSVVPGPFNSVFIRVD